MWKQVSECALHVINTPFPCRRSDKPYWRFLPRQAEHKCHQAQKSESFHKELSKMKYYEMEKVVKLGGELRCGTECWNVPIGPITMVRLRPVI